MASIGLEDFVEPQNKPKQEIGTDNAVEQEQQHRKEIDSFLRLLSDIYDQNQKACRFKINDPLDPKGRKKIKLEDWLEKTKVFIAAPPHIGNLELPATGHLELPGGFKTSDITFEQKRVSIDLDQFEDDPNAMSLNALAIAMAASASKEMRTKGVVIEADTPEQQAALFMACQALGLRVRKTPEIDPQIMQKAQQDLGEAWQKYAAAMDGKYDFAAEKQAQKADAPEIDIEQQTPDEEPPTETETKAAPEADDTPDETPPEDTLIGSTGPHPVKARSVPVINVPAENIGLLDEGNYGRAQGAQPSAAPVEQADNSEPPQIISEEDAAALQEKIAQNPSGESSPIAARPAEPEPDLTEFDEEANQDADFGDEDAPTEKLVLTEDQRVYDDEDALETAKDAEASPAAITSTFNENVLPEEIANRLEALNIDPDLYKKIRSTVVETQDARRNTLKNTFADEGLKASQITAVVETLDSEGITSPQDRPGASRRVNFTEDGSPKPPQVS